MTEDYLTVFENKAIRIFDHEGEIWIPLVDLAASWGIDRKTPANLIDRNSDLFEGMVIVLGEGVTYQSGNVTYQNERVINERGLYLLMGKISADRLKNPEAKAAMIRFQRWVPELIQKYRKKEIVQAPAISLDGELQKARHLAEQTGGNLAAFQKIALSKCGMGDYAPALDAAPVIVHGETGWYNPTRLVALCNDPDLNPERLNWYLKNKGFQYRENGIWRLTPEGLIHGREYPFNAPSGHSEPRIAWRESVLYASGLKRPLSENQISLPVRA